MHDSSSLQESQPEDDRPAKDWILPKEAELRVEVGNENVVDIRVRVLFNISTMIEATTYGNGWDTL